MLSTTFSPISLHSCSTHHSCWFVLLTASIISLSPQLLDGDNPTANASKEIKDLLCVLVFVVLFEEGQQQQYHPLGIF